jgi:hypothetical protein
MFSNSRKPFEEQPAAKGGHRIRVHVPAHAPSTKSVPERKPTFAKIFRWRLPAGQTRAPATVEIVGSFTGWERVPLARDNEVDLWHVTIHQIPVNRTHHYMLLVDGKPVPDKHADGLAVPHGPQEKHYQLMTERGGRVFMLYAQTK